MSSPKRRGSGSDGSSDDVCRGIFDDIALRVISYLEAHPVVQDVELRDRGGVSQPQLLAWEAENGHFQLPEDLKSFLTISNGVTVRWNVRINGNVQEFGCMHLNQLSQIKRLTIGGSKGVDGQCGLGSPSSAAGATAFDLDAECCNGRVALLYREAPSKPQVWFQDLSCDWHFIANTFTDYFRLMAMHLGIPHWQYAFTDVGLDPVTRNWFALFCPERLAVAVENGKDASRRQSRHGRKLQGSPSRTRRGRSVRRRRGQAGAARRIISSDTGPDGRPNSAPPPHPRETS